MVIFNTDTEHLGTTTTNAKRRVVLNFNYFNMSFKKNKYTVIRQAISKDLATFIANYFVCKTSL